MADPMNDLFDEELETAAAALIEEKHETGKIQAAATRTRRLTRRARSEAHLAEVWPVTLNDGTAYHFISQGDVDALTYLAQILKTQRLDFVLFSTWCMALDDVVQFEKWLISGTIGRVDAYCGEIFPNQYADEHALLCDVIRAHDGRVCVFRNHSKIMVGYGPGIAFAIESSANLNTNPRAEQTVITVDRSLADFYREFFAGVRSFNRDFDDCTPWCPPQ